MYLKIDEELLERIQNITNVDYGAEGDFISYLAVESIIEDLLIELDTLQEKYNDLEQDIEDNYRPIPVSEQYGISERDFI